MSHAATPEFDESFNAHVQKLQAEAAPAEAAPAEEAPAEAAPLDEASADAAVTGGAGAEGGGGDAFMGFPPPPNMPVGLDADGSQVFYEFTRSDDE